MAKPTNIKTGSASPSEALIEKAQEAVTVKDKKGRVIGLRDPGILAEFELVRVVGPETAKNETYMGMVNYLTYVHEIDGENIPMPNSKLKLDALIQRLGRDGVQVVMAKVAETFGEIDPEADKAAIKK